MNELDIEQLRNALNEPFRILSEAFAVLVPIICEALTRIHLAVLAILGPMMSASPRRVRKQLERSNSNGRPSRYKLIRTARRHDEWVAFCGRLG